MHHGHLYSYLVDPLSSTGRAWCVPTSAPSPRARGRSGSSDLLTPGDQEAGSLGACSDRWLAACTRSRSPSPSVMQTPASETAIRRPPAATSLIVPGLHMAPTGCAFSTNGEMTIHRPTMKLSRS